MIFIVYGTRAELIKFSPLIRDLKRRKTKFKTVDIGQHDNESLQKSLRLPKPDFHLGKSLRPTWSKLEATFVTYPIASLLALAWGFKVFVKLARILSSGDIIVTHGNAMGVPLAIYATKFSTKKPKLVHTESGLRGNTSSARLVDFFFKFADKRSDILFTPFKSAEKNLKAEDIKGKIILSGDLMKDVVRETLKIRPKIKMPKGDYVVANITRSIVNRHDAKNLLYALVDSPIDVILIMNPVIRKRIEKFRLDKLLKSEKIKVMLTMDYPDFLHLIKNSKGTITDSTGVEEECAFMEKPCIVTNDFLQIPELEEFGIVKKTGRNYIAILNGLRKIKNGTWKIKAKNLFGSSSPTKKIANYLIALERSV